MDRRARIEPSAGSRQSASEDRRPAAETGRFRAAAIAAAVSFVGACASASGTPKPAEPGLMMPIPPPHVVPIAPEPIVEPVADVPAPPNAGAPAPRSGRPVREPRPPAGESRPEAKTDAPAPDTPAPAVPAPSAPAPQLRTAESSGAETAVRAAIDRARGLLSNVDYRRLTTVHRKAYDDAKTFAQQAEDALKAGNVVFAQSVAAKAETLARELAGK